MGEEEKPTYSPPQPPHSLSGESKPLASRFNEATPRDPRIRCVPKDAETTGTTTQADELIVGGLGISGSIGGWDDTWTNSFTQQTTVAHCIASATGIFESTDGWNQDNKAFGVIATFKGA